jgi:2-polyprenyl-3-methyl-5-hydroxy-6-metoxy-1,4-benzoquinol methylase
MASASASRLNSVELKAMNGWFRRFSQRRFELPAFTCMLESAGIDLRGKRILDAGCGAGSTLSLLADKFDPSRLAGFDLMPELVEVAQKAQAGAEVKVGDVTAIEEADASFDAVFVFGVLHHVPAWRDGLKEIARVLVPGGVLLIEELHGRAVDFEDRFIGTSHPREARFDWPTLRSGMRGAGLDIVAEQSVVCCTPIRWPLFGAARAFLCRRRQGIEAP